MVKDVLQGPAEVLIRIFFLGVAGVDVVLIVRIHTVFQNKHVVAHLVQDVPHRKSLREQAHAFERTA